MPLPFLRTIGAFCCVVLLSGCQLYGASAHAPATPVQPVPGQAAVASAHPAATEAGMAVLRNGGNAFDAAIAVAAALAVVEPYSAGMGGGGFWLLYEAERDRYTLVDARETAPLAAHATMYLDKQGEPLPDRPSINGPLAAGIPGQAAAFAHIAEHYGNLPLTASLKDAIHLADNGFQVTPKYRRLAGFRVGVMQGFAASANTFLDEGALPELGYRVTQPALARTLEALAQQGHDGFYQGPVAERLVADVNAAGGIWSLQDLAQYRVVEREPIRFTYQGHEIITTPPPSSGGVALAEILNMLSHFDLQALTPVQQVHLISETMRRAYKDRAVYLGDSDFVDVPVARLTSLAHARQWVESINLSAATPSASLNGPTPEAEGTHTTHLSVLDKDGNRVAATLSINLPFGSGFTSAATGVLLNNEMDDFSIKPGAPNAYGLVGNQQNAIAPGKRPLSSMTPTMVESEQATAILGTPGGSRIITMVLLGLLEHVAGNPPEAWVSRSRFHHQYLPDVIQHEPDTFTDKEKAELEALGHKLRDVNRSYGNMQAILWDRRNQRVQAAADPRGEGQAQVE